MVTFCWLVSMTVLWFLGLGGFIAGVHAVWINGLDCGDLPLVFHSIALLLTCPIVAAVALGWIV